MDGGLDCARADVKSLLEVEREGNVEEMHNLLKQGLDVNVVNDDGDGPLLISASHGHLDFVRALTEMESVTNNGLINSTEGDVLTKINVDIQNYAGTTAVGAAAQSGHDSIDCASFS